jgi:flagellar biosynthesis protein FlhA
VTQEADFYGSMDGASKFVRGDAIAGILIMVINVVGGLLVGVLQHGMDMGHAAESYTLLTIGDGLVAQIPALVISTAAGVIVTRVSTDQDVGEQMVGQLFSNPRVMLLAAAVLGLLGLVPGMPNLVFLLFTAGCWALPGGCAAVKPNRQRSLFRSKCRRIPRPSKRPGTTFSWKIHWEWKWAIA